MEEACVLRMSGHVLGAAGEVSKAWGRERPCDVRNTETFIELGVREGWL